MSEHSNNEGPFDNNANLSQPKPSATDSTKSTAEQDQHRRYDQEPQRQEEQPHQPYTQAGYQQAPYGQQDAYYQQSPNQQGSYQQGQQTQFQQSYGQQQQQNPYQQEPYTQGQYQQGQYNQYQYPPQPNGYPYQQPVYIAKKTNTKSIVSLILGIASIMLPYIGFFIGIAGIIVSSLSLKELKQRPEDGKGLAISGLVTSIIGTLIYGAILFIFVLAIAFFAESNNYYY